ncbi:MAG: phosphatase PAP2 family protein [Bacteroidales bacterium]|jgi:undecaprenyl-diphosphatase|nr:phosphatase PAP2 family protein [Bacteroidales bacterium]
MLEIIKNLDTNLFVFLNSINSPFFDQVMWLLSAKETWYPLYLIIIAYIIYKYKKKSIILLISIAILITLADQTSVHLFKEVFQRFRPCHNPQIQDIVHLVNNKCGGKYGFVSSHATNVFSLALFLSFIFKNKFFTIGIFFWATIVSYSRIYLGVHYPLDILGGAALGSILAYIIHKFYLFTNNYFISRRILQ